MSGLTRPRHPMPSDVEAVLVERGLMDAYRARPDYQQNDWIGWIARAKREVTRRKRIEEMCGDLMAGDRYMGMDWRPARNRSAGFGGDA